MSLYSKIGGIFVATMLLFAFAFESNEFFAGAAANTDMFVSVTNVNLNGKGNSIGVEPGATIQVTFNYQLWNPSSGPIWIVQIVVGLDNTPISCVYDGVPGVKPGK